MAQQPYTVTVGGQVVGCTPNSFVNIVTLPGTVPALDIDVPVVSPSCSFSATLNLANPAGGFTVSTPCQGVLLMDSVLYETDPVLDTAMVYVVLNCGNSAPDCLGVPGGSAQPGSACSNPATGQSGTWNTNCECIPNANACQACINVVSNQPWSAGFINCSSGTGPFTYQWWLPDGSTASSTNADWVFTSAGVYGVCLTIADAGGCTSVACDTVYVDANGSISLDQPPPCSANFTATQGFANGSTVPFGVEVISIEANNIGGPTPTVDWGDGNTTVIGSHLYAAAGTYTICVNATNPQGVTCSSCRPITIDANGTLSTSTQTPPFQLQVQVGMTGGCSPGTIVRLRSIQGTLPVFEVDYVLDSTCSFIDLLDMTSSSGWIQATYFCDTETTTSALAYDFGGGSSGVGFFFSNCPGAVDCLGVLGGTATPGTPCNDPATGQGGIWSANCECVPNNPVPCQADFWVLQAYQNTNNGDTTQVEPIPFQLWIWNLSSGGTGNYQFLWSFGDGTSSTEPFPTHTYASAGPYQLCLTITDDAGCTSTHCETIEVDQDGFLGMAPGPDVRSTLTINVVQELPTGIAERTELEAGNLWPNPVQDSFTMQVNSSRSGTVELSIMDLHGREVYRGSVALQAGSNRMDLNVDQLQGGLYLLRLTSGRQASVLRFVKH